MHINILDGLQVALQRGFKYLDISSLIAGSFLQKVLGFGNKDPLYIKVCKPYVTPPGGA